MNLAGIHWLLNLHHEILRMCILFDIVLQILKEIQIQVNDFCIGKKPVHFRQVKIRDFIVVSVFKKSVVRYS